ncbi:MAG: hypothetical protein QF921_10240 [Pseudomonadales bacterium]|jgi:Skp family chaperone for outer membrane proteins|nr:hypothetical protein [Pseudomonadales bacterium]MDP6469713.1 hypothetical protein [Pseudomonadales bacterium]MDP6827686.1 hypothetical protein [Pseudomonadales bacterium]MDP6971874.1 hypothetical protein [Pseudomonadales bacterium]|tara:strand:- start:795 stop:1208 length:414 start_codon:yes stop_codon:yes gene_type:complete
MKIVLRCACCALLLMTTSVSSASKDELAAEISNCAFTDPPMFLDPTSTSQEEMAQLADHMQGYVQHMQGALTCLTDKETRFRDQMNKEQRLAVAAIYNNGVEQLNYVVEEYNRLVRAFNRESRGYDPLTRPNLREHR